MSLSELADSAAAVSEQTLPAQAGHGIISVALVDGLSTVTACAGRSPLKLLATAARAETAWIYSSSFGGGLVAGDTVSLSVDIGAHAHAAMGTQSTTKIYRSTQDQRARQHVSAHVAAHGSLSLLPDPVTCFADSRYEQQQDIYLGEHASLLLIDPLTSGRFARDERWAFSSYRSRNRIYRSGHTSIIDTTLLENVPHSPLARRMGRYHALCTLFMVGPRFTALADDIKTMLATETCPKDAELLASASPCQDGVLVRLCATRYELIDHFFKQHCLSAIQLSGNYWQRKP
jgi:urease accessory protein